jgi:thiamine-phosphate pyrophosphorylase
MLHIIHAGPGSTTRLLINSRPDIAIAAGADGVHLPAGEGSMTPAEVRAIFAQAASTKPPAVSISCHTLDEVEAARRQNPDCILFAPVFEKRIGAADERGMQSLPGTGVELLQQACRAAAPIPVIALGGVNASNAAECLQAGASGIAAIRLLRQPPAVWRDFN